MLRAQWPAWLRRRPLGLVDLCHAHTILSGIDARVGSAHENERSDQLAPED
jgi:hypothetical protein